MKRILRFPQKANPEGRWFTLWMTACSVVWGCEYLGFLVVVNVNQDCSVRYVTFKSYSYMKFFQPIDYNLFKEKRGVRECRIDGPTCSGLDMICTKTLPEANIGEWMAWGSELWTLQFIRYRSSNASFTVKKGFCFLDNEERVPISHIHHGYFT